MNELKPCPYCGADAELSHWTPFTNEKISYIKCRNYECQARTKSFMMSFAESSNDKAILAWNRRINNG